MKFGVAALATVALVIGLSVGLKGNNKDTTNALSASNGQGMGFDFANDCPDVMRPGKSGKSGSTKSGKSGSAKSGKSGSMLKRRLGHSGRGESCLRLYLRDKDLSLSSFTHRF